MSSVGYDLWYKVDETVSQEDFDASGKLDVGIRCPPVADLPPGEQEVARIGELQLTTYDRTKQSEKPARYTPLLATRVTPVGIDSSVWTRNPASKPASARATSPSAGVLPFDKPSGDGSGKKAAAKDRPRVPGVKEILRRLGVPMSRWVLSPTAPLDSPHVAEKSVDPPKEPGCAPPKMRVAVLDTEFAANGADRSRHGDRVMGVVSKVLHDTPSEVFSVPVPRSKSYRMPYDIALGIAKAVADGAQVVLIALSSGRWGTPDYLDAVLTEVGQRVVVVTSTGRDTDNQTPVEDLNNPRIGERQSAALGADELASHPDVLAVGPGDLDGRWFRRAGEREPRDRPDRRSSGIRGRMGPAVALLGPGVVVRSREAASEGSGSALIDESSLASGVVAGVVALMRMANPHLSPAEIKWLLRKTAFVPVRADVSRGVESGENASFDAEGHNFKVGAGMVHPLASVLASADPICQALIAAGEAPGLSEDAEGILALHSHMLAAWFRYWTASPELRDDRRVIYAKLAPLLARRLIHSITARDELLWAARHLLAIFAHEGPHQWRKVGDEEGRSGKRDHGALLRRLTRLGYTLWIDLKTNDKKTLDESLDWSAQLAIERALEIWSIDPEKVEDKIREAIFGEPPRKQEDEGALKARPPLTQGDLVDQLAFLR